MPEENTSSQIKRTAAGAGWRLSRYNLTAELPEKGTVAIANLYKKTCGEYGPADLFLMHSLDKISENHPIIPRLAKRGVIVNFDELTALETVGRISCCSGSVVGLTICPTLGCNFDCPYCFENHRSGKMSPEVQEDILSLARRMMKAGKSEKLNITWYGGEPLLAPDVISSLSSRLMALAEEHQAVYKAEVITNGYLLTPENVKILEAANVSRIQVTIDGIGTAHDTTRHLTDGSPTFERIITNLRQPLPFRVNIRHNVHGGNRDETEKLGAFIEELAKGSGNTFRFFPKPVFGSYAAEQRGSRLDLLDRPLNWKGSLHQEKRRPSLRPDFICAAHMLFCVTIDEKGRLYKCLETVADPKLSFGNAGEWDPADPLTTASNPDNLMMFLNAVCPVQDEECRECIWLPVCGGSCTYHRLFRKRLCFSYRDDPEKYVRMLLNN